eukprot:1184136-Prorocentrum_minimum.AAC.5
MLIDGVRVHKHRSITHRLEVQLIGHKCATRTANRSSYALMRSSGLDSRVWPSPNIATCYTVIESGTRRPNSLGKP